MELGILKKDGIYFPTISDFAKANLYYPHWGATYVCDKPYEVIRPHHDSCILFYIREGKLHFRYRDQYFCAKKDQIVILSGKFPNHYYATEQVHFNWFHFSGGATEEYVELLYNMKGAIFTEETSLQAKAYVKEMMTFLKSNIGDEHMATLYIQGIFSLLTQSNKDVQKNEDIQKACDYLDVHFKDSISVKNLATRFNLSPFHFSRLFKKEVGSSPHQYLVNRRLLEAKQLLANTNMTVETVAMECGFSSTSHFIRAFKGAMDITPKQFRKMPF
jgi:AraC-like DNA-binding protein